VAPTGLYALVTIRLFNLPPKVARESRELTRIGQLDELRVHGKRSEFFRLSTLNQILSTAADQGELGTRDAE
jgi:hypothetical protein